MKKILAVIIWSTGEGIKIFMAYRILFLLKKLIGNLAVVDSAILFWSIFCGVSLLAKYSPKIEVNLRGGKVHER